MYLPKELRTLVKQAVSLLGEVIQQEVGHQTYRQIDSLREEMTRARSQTLLQKTALLTRQYKKLKTFSPQKQLHIAHAYTLMLELMNACENAYRTYRIRQDESQKQSSFSKPETDIVYVLTAHPTESRSPENILLFSQIRKALVDILSSRFELHQERLKHLLEIVWHLHTSRYKKPRVEDEAKYIYSVVLRPEILTLILNADTELAHIRIRTWVGGDKDGNPYVNETALQNSLQYSRLHLYDFTSSHLDQIKHTLNLLRHHPSQKTLILKLKTLKESLRRLKALTSQDGKRITTFHKLLLSYNQFYQKTLGTTHPSLQLLIKLLQKFPALVIPLELRESSELILHSISNTKTKNFAIRKMLCRLHELADGGCVTDYARGLIISMTESTTHILAGMTLVKKTLGDLRLPVIPLFETQSALTHSPQIIDQLLSHSTVKKALRDHWQNNYEVMLGYSDSAKEMGVLASRLGIATTVYELETIFKRHHVKPIYFHGSGGSVDRGGGSVREQMAWWPHHAVRIYKATIQGEMIERSFSNPEITKRQFERIVQSAHDVLKRSRWVKLRDLRHFAQKVSQHYQTAIRSPLFLKMVEEATPYPYLKALKIGSRPTKRHSKKKSLDVLSLRAIPWVLCWTQTRVLFPTWWGVGLAWTQLSKFEQKKLRRLHETNPLFSSYVKLLGFTLAKVELAVWKLYLEESHLTPKQKEDYFLAFEKEYQRSLKFVRDLSRSRKLVWFRPWLGDSIHLRTAMIHPLNLLQLIAMKENHAELMRETVTGIASGMMTTG